MMRESACGRSGVWLSGALVTVAVAFATASWMDRPVPPAPVRPAFTASSSEEPHRLWLPWAGRNGHPAVLQTVGHFSNDLGPIQTLAVDESAGVVYAGQGSRIVIIDVSQRGNPRELRRLEPLGAVIEDLRLRGDRLYAAVGSAGLVIIDRSKPAEPIIAGTFADRIHRIVAGDKGVIATAGAEDDLAGTASRILSIDVAEPGRPMLLDTLTARRICPYTDVDISGDWAYVSADVCGLFAVDIGRPELMRIDYSGYASGRDGGRLRVNDDIVFQVVEGATVEMRDARRLEAEGLGRVDRFVFADGETWYTDVTRDLAVQAGRLLMVGRFDRQPVPDDEGLWVVDVSDPRHPVLLAAAESAAPAAVAGTQSHIYVAGADGLLIYPAVP